MKIYRYSIQSYGITEIKIPFGAQIIDAIYQSVRNEFSIYAETPSASEQYGQEVSDIAASFETRKIAVLPTGANLPNLKRHIRSIVMPDGYHVFHVYEVG